MVIVVFVCSNCDANTQSGEFLTHPNAGITDVNRKCKCGKTMMVRIENEISEVGV